MKKYLLDTNMISLIMRHHPNVRKHLEQKDIHQLYISVISYGEIQYGLAKNPQATKLKLLADEIFKRISVLSFTEQTAVAYAHLRTDIEKSGKMLSAFDMLIAAQAKSEDYVLVTNDQAFFQVANLEVEDWTI